MLKQWCRSYWSYADPDPQNLVNADPDPGQKNHKIYFEPSFKSQEEKKIKLVL